MGYCYICLSYTRFLIQAQYIYFCQVNLIRFSAVFQSACSFGILIQESKYVSYLLTFMFKFDNYAVMVYLKSRSLIICIGA